MSLYADYLNQIETRKEQGLHPKPIEDAALVEALIAQIEDPNHAHRADSLQFFIYNTPREPPVQLARRPSSSRKS